MLTNVTFEESLKMPMKGRTSAELVFAENIVAIICKALAILLILRLLFYVILKPSSLKQRQPSGGMVVLIFVHLVRSARCLTIFILSHRKAFHERLRPANYVLDRDFPVGRLTIHPAT